MADDQERSDEAPPWEVPEWLRRESPRLTEAFLACRLPTDATAILWVILDAPKMRWAWGEITRSTRGGRARSNRYHPLTFRNGELPQRLHNMIPADAMNTVEQVATMPEMEVREGIFAVLVLYAAVIASFAVIEDFAPELRAMGERLRDAKRTAEKVAAMGLIESAEGIADAAHDSYVELKEQLSMERALFRTHKEREEFLVLCLAAVTRSNLSGDTLNQSIATIASAALGRIVGKDKVRGIVKRKLVEWANQNRVVLILRNVK